MELENHDALLREQRHLIQELQRIQAALDRTPEGESPQEVCQPRFAGLAPGNAIRKLLAEEGHACTRATIVWELISGQANVGDRHAEENVLRAIEVNLELGLLVQVRDKISLPEWQNNERPRHRMAKDSRILFVIRKMHTDLHEQFSMEQLAEKVQLSPSQLSRLFHKEIGMTPLDYSRRIKMRIARSMLKKTSLKQKQILAMTGIADRSHFSKEFKKLFRKSPSEVRSKAGTGHSTSKKVRPQIPVPQRPSFWSPSPLVPNWRWPAS